MVGSGFTNALLFALIMYVARQSRCQTLQNAKDLLTDLLDEYNRNLRPVENQASPLVLYAGFELVSISDVDEVTQTLTLIGMFRLNWVDDSMKWDPSKYGYLYQVFAESGQFWTPTLVLTTSNEKLKKFGDSWLGIRYTSSGVSYYYPGDIFATACKMDITYFPFDQHECQLSFTAWGQTPEEIYIYNTSWEVQTNYFSPNGAWELISTKVHVVRVPYILTSYNVILNIRRRPKYVVMNVIIPIIFLTMLNIIVFFIPIDSGERISFCITLLLAIAVFLTIIGDNLPKTSSPMSIFSYYLLAVLITSNCITLATIFSIGLYYTDDSKPVKPFWRGFVFLMGCKCFCRRKLTAAGETISYKRNQVQPLISVIETEITERRSRKLDPKERLRLQSNKQMTEIIENVSPEVDLQIHWKDVSIAFDRFCLIFFFLALCAATATLFGIIIVGSKDASTSE